MLSQLSCYQLKIRCYKIVYVSLVVNTKEKTVVVTQKITIKKSKHTKQEVIHHITQKENRISNKG